MKISCVVVVVVAVMATADSASKQPFKSAKAPRETIENYEMVMPVIREGDSHQPYSLDLYITIPSEVENYSLVLHMNQAAVPSGFTSMYYNEYGKLVKDTSHYDNCYYQGTVEDHPNWTATMAVCQGLQGEFGMPANRDEFYHIEPLHHYNSDMAQVHVIYKDTEYKIPQGRCGSGDGHSVMDHVFDTSKMNTTSERIRRQTSSEFMEWVVVNDMRQYQTFGSNLTTTVQRALAIANGMDAIYNSNLGIRIILINTITFTNGDSFTVVSSPNGLLSSFSNYVDTNLLNSEHYDSIMLLTGIDIDGSTVGVAYVGTMCLPSSSIGFSQDGGRSLSSVVVTAAHELGHNFNMAHDDEQSSCTCTDSAGYCVMAAASRSTPTMTFSSCSMANLQSLREQRPLTCLTNTPTTNVGMARCGNGILEGDEVCDCGEPDHCSNPCCNATTCQLASNAQCAFGTCCNMASCSFKSSSTVCRNSTGECDLQEMCTGSSANCPADITVVDGTSCLSNTGYCVSGQCPTHAAQCMASFGTGDGFSACYNDNTRGIGAANCGHSSGAYISCATSNVRCGLLQCRQGSYTGIYTTIGTIWTYTTSSGVCNSYSLSPTSTEVNPGLVDEGTKCGDGRVCQAQSCQTISAALNPPTCPTGSNGLVCSGSSRGICNSLGQCTCQSGFVPPRCEPETLVNECNTNNGGCAQVCTDTTSSFTCSCNSGYTLDSNGRSCNDIDECTSGTHNCAQVCNNNAGSFTCSCGTGYILNSDSRTCSDIVECDTNNGGCSQRCTNTEGSFSCECFSGYTLSSDGRTCTDIDECTTNGHNCAQVCHNNQGSFTCDCNTGYTLSSDGRSCSDINECATNNGGCEQTCVNEQGTFSCSCNTGYTLSGGNLCIDINECNSNNGGCSQICTNNNGSFVCSCHTGFVPSNTQCIDIDECTAGTDNCDQICENNDGSFSCNCNTGYILSSDTINCDDINECAANNGGCAHTCTNNPGSFTCSCNSGFELTSDGRGCVVIDQCDTNRDNCDQFCMQSGTTVTCSCRTGYALQSDGTTCTDINECATNNGGCAHTCSNSLGSFSCFCNLGYLLDADGRSCIDADECTDNRGGCDQLCINTDGSFTCGCNTGYVLLADGINCVDVDECLLPSGQSCEDTCINTDGSFMCSCPNGFALNGDGKTCSDINECKNNARCAHICENTNGSFRCDCNPGYVLSSNGFSCDDINECQGGDYGGCDQVCLNWIGYHNCTCWEGFELQNEQTCVTLESSKCQNDNGCSQFCHSVGDADICSCRAGFSLDTDGKECNDIDECRINGSNYCEEICTNTVGGYTCSCETAGTEIAVDKISCINITLTEGESQQTQAPSNPSGGVPVAAIAGGIVGGILLVLIVLGAVVGLLVYSKRRSPKSLVPATGRGPSYKPPPSTTSHHMAKSASAEDLLDERPSTTNDDYETDDSFDDVEPAVYGNVTYDPVLDKHVPKRKKAPPPPTGQGKNVPPSRAAPRRTAPAAPAVAAAAVALNHDKVQNGTKFANPTSDRKQFGLSKVENKELELTAAPKKHDPPKKPLPVFSKPPPPPSDKPTPPWVKTTAAQSPTGATASSTKPIPPPTKPISSAAKPTPPTSKPNPPPTTKPTVKPTPPSKPSDQPTPPWVKPNKLTEEAPPSYGEATAAAVKLPPSYKPTPPSNKPASASKPVPLSAKSTSVKPVPAVPSKPMMAVKPSNPRPQVPTKPTTETQSSSGPVPAPRPAPKPTAPKPAPRHNDVDSGPIKPIVPTKKPIAPPRR